MLQYHPANAQAYARRAKLEVLCGDGQAAAECAATALQRLAVCNPSSSLVPELRQIASDGSRAGPRQRRPPLTAGLAGLQLT